MQILSRWCEASELTTFKGGGSAFTYFPCDSKEFIEALNAFGREGVKPYILGGGSDTIIADGRLKTPIICTRRMRWLAFEDDIVRFEAGVYVAELMREARARNLGGLEFLEGVPATLGGAIGMNAGAFGSSMSDFKTRVKTLTARGGEYVVEEKTPRYAYRRGERDIVLCGELKLLPISARDSMTLRNKFIARRREKQPRLPSCGSVFSGAIVSEKQLENLPLSEEDKSKIRSNRTLENAFLLPAGLLIERAGLKGLERGGAQISCLHANFIVNLGGATATEFLYLAGLCKREVFERFGIILDEEFRLLSC